jgi:hypothetical protein
MDSEYTLLRGEFWNLFSMISDPTPKNCETFVYFLGTLQIREAYPLKPQEALNISFKWKGIHLIARPKRSKVPGAHNFP